jgi:feruloyl-CoA synthase
MRPPASATIETRADGTLRVTCGHALDAPVPVIDVLVQRAAIAGDAPFLVERDAQGVWQRTSYASFERRSAAIACGLARMGAGPGTRIALLSENSVAHALVVFAAMRIGATAAPLSPAWSLHDDLTLLRSVAPRVAPTVLFAESGVRFARALDAIATDERAIVTADGTRGRSLAALEAAGGADPAATAALLAERRPVARGDTPAKLFFTSGSTGAPKGVLTTHAMLAAGMAMYGQLAERFDPPQVILDWLPWHHVYGGNVQLHHTLFAGGTLWIDGGRPVAGRFAQTLANLRDVSPTLYGSVPVAFTMLADALEADADLRTRFFANLRGLRYGGGSLAQATCERIQRLAIATVGHPIPFSSGWGMTETSGCGIGCWWDVDRTGIIGLPFPGVTLKLVPLDDARHELRIRGPQVFDGYVDADVDADARDTFDDEGFFRTGDATVWDDPSQPLAGLRFAGRLAEQFKLDSGTFVQSGAVRLALLEALAPLVREAVIAAPDRPYLGALVWPNATADAPATLHAAIAERLAAYNALAGGSSRRIERAVLVDTPLAMAAGEVTDKGSVNQRRVLERRAALVAALYADVPDARVIVAPAR